MFRVVVYILFINLFFYSIKIRLWIIDLANGWQHARV